MKKVGAYVLMLFTVTKNSVGSRTAAFNILGHSGSAHVSVREPTLLFVNEEMKRKERLYRLLSLGGLLLDQPGPKVV